MVILFISYRLVRDSKTFSLPQNGDKVPSASAQPVLGVYTIGTIFF